jgi:hypothetical protein
MPPILLLLSITIGSLGLGLAPAEKTCKMADSERLRDLEKADAGIMSSKPLLEADSEGRLRDIHTPALELNLLRILWAGVGADLELPWSWASRKKPRLA